MLALQRFAGNRSLARALSGRSGRPLQRMILALDDELAVEDRRRRGEPTTTQEKARVTSNSVRDRSQNFPDRQVRPYDHGGLANIPRSESLLVFGHGGSNTDGMTVTIGGYTADQLARVLIVDLGLPREYAGEIHLTGCKSARGFLQKFHAILTEHCPHAAVRGSLGDTATLPDGTLGVSKGEMTEDEIEKCQAAYIDAARVLLTEATEIERRRNSGGADDPETLRQLLDLRREMLAVSGKRLTFLHSVYDTTGALTLQIPAKDAAK
jgi:hypothetical protein